MPEPFVLPSPHSVVIKPYDPLWPSRAVKEGMRLAGVLGANLCKVEHIGSTSVPGLAAKPIIDLMPLVSNLTLLDRDHAMVESLEYRWHGEYGIEGRRFCTLTNGNGERLVNVHFFQSDSPQIERHLAFRDYLRAQPEVARQYEAEKRRAAALHPGDGNAYNEEKWGWVAQTEREALKWFELNGRTGKSI
jgi:GrpB-like predicted nucleotidyltransferase (UPF0157 family)